MSTAVERLGFRVSVNVKRHLEEAARLLRALFKLGFVEPLQVPHARRR
jgi:hypothetical protein